LNNEKKEFVLSKQVLRSGTSIGANIEESIGGHIRFRQNRQILFSIEQRSQPEGRFCAWLIFGVDNNHKIVGSNYCSQRKDLDSLKRETGDKTMQNISLANTIETEITKN
jgi:four helix bundle protein